MPDSKPQIPDEMIAKWQRVVDILARLLTVPAGLIMKRADPKHLVFVSSVGEENPYEPEQSFDLNSGLYCDTVMESRDLLVVRNARLDPEWDRNPDLKHNMLFYLGLPLIWPDGSLFGTICVLDSKENDKAVAYADLLSEFKEVVDSDLKFLVEMAERKRAQSELQRARDELESRVEVRTRELAATNEGLKKEIASRKRAERALLKREAELEETNTALKVLLHRVEDSRGDFEEKILWNIEELVLPYLEKLKRGTVDERNRSYLAILESNLKAITEPFSSRLSSKFSRLTPTEVEIAKLIMQGKTTKEIAGLLTVATSTVDFHRNNIRKKVGLNSVKVNLRSYLSSLH